MMEPLKRLPDSELEVMLIIWQSSKALHTGEILQKLSEKKTCTLQMVQSTLNRLAGKSFVRCDKIGRLNYFTPLVAEDAYRAQETQSFIEKLYHSSPGKLVATLLAQQTISKEELEEIRRLLERSGD